MPRKSTKRTNGAEREALPPTFAAPPGAFDEEPEILNELQESSRLTVWRILPGGGRPKYLCSVLMDEIAEEGVFEYLRRIHGGGTYRLMLYDEEGNYDKSRRVDIDGPPAAAPPVPPAAAPPIDAGGNALLAILMEQNRVLMNAMVNRPAQQSDLVGMAALVTAILPVIVPKESPTEIALRMLQHMKGPEHKLEDVLAIAEAMQPPPPDQPQNKHPLLAALEMLTGKKAAQDEEDETDVNDRSNLLTEILTAWKGKKEPPEVAAGIRAQKGKRDAVDMLIELCRLPWETVEGQLTDTGMIPKDSMDWMRKLYEALK